MDLFGPFLCSFDSSTLLAYSISFAVLVSSAVALGFLWRKPQRKIQSPSFQRRTKDLTWRLFITPSSGTLPSPVTSDALRTALEKRLGLSLSDSKLVLAQESHRYCATLSMKCEKSPFELGKAFDLEIDIESDLHISATITPDNTFFRMTTLYDGTKDAQHADQTKAVDLIVVPGLSSHAFGSFKSPRDATENWLRDYLPTTLPNIRVLVYGYDSHLLAYEGKESIVDHAKGLLDSIRSHRLDPQTAHRPVVFLGHSLGGLLIKEALTTLSREIGRNEQDERLFKACYGLLFFGVPNLGLRHEELLEAVIGKKPSENLIRDLIVTREAEPSAFLTALSENFVHCCKLQEFKVVAFYETLNSSTVGQDADGKWGRSGAKKLMVTKASATWIHGQANSRKEIPLSADHSGLVKFSGMSDPQYADSVKFHIEEMVTAAPLTINERFSRMHELSPGQRAVLDRLRLDPVHEIRDGKIDNPCADTLKWFFDDSRFQSWRDSPEASCFWVYGSPGQGKSVLAKSLADHLEEHGRTRPAENIAVLSFFCYGQREQFRRPTDVLRSLIIQLIDCKELFEYLPERYFQDPATFLGDPLSRLWEQFSKMVLDDRHQRIYCVIDALDECDQNGDQRSDFLRRLVELFSKDNGRLKLFVTSRPGEKDIESRLSSKSVLKFPLNAQKSDLNIYVESKVNDLPDYLFTDQLKEQVQEKICAQAGGTFLWASLVMKQIAKLEAPSLYEVERVFEESPSELDDLYYRLVARLTVVPVCAKVLAWVAYAQRALTVDELRDAINYDPGQHQYERLSEMTKYRPTITEEWIRRSLGTLLSVQKKEDDPNSSSSDKDANEYVFFIHQSVKDFFHQRAETPLNNCGAIGDAAEPDAYLARTCLFYLTADEFRDVAAASGGDGGGDDDGSMSAFAALVRKARAAGDFLRDNRFHSDIFEGECARLSDARRFPFLAYASAHWHRHLATDAQVEGEWAARIEPLLDARRPYLAVTRVPTKRR